ncbi:MAG TPA: hypothetical protein VJ837_05685 [Candidatus Paceibacterota bacterium]|nr:hypothetical protein [Candidatus Paceibacterota bacterium]
MIKKLLGSVADEFAAEYLMKGLGWLFGGKKATDTPVTPETLNVTRAERQEVMLVIYGAPENGAARAGRGPGIDPQALRNFEWLHGTLSRSLGDKLEEALAAALKQLKNGVWPGTLETINIRPPQQRGRRGGPPPIAQKTTTTQRTVPPKGWEPHRVFVRGFNHGFETRARAKKFFRVLTEEGFVDPKTVQRLKEQAKRLALTVLWTWIGLLILTGVGTAVTLWWLFKMDTPGVGIALLWLLCFAGFAGLLAIPVHAVSRR